MATTEPWLIVTPRQVKEGWIKRQGSALGKGGVTHERREYEVIKKLEDGNYQVRNPALTLLEEEA